MTNIACIQVAKNIPLNSFAAKCSSHRPLHKNPDTEIQQMPCNFELRGVCCRFNRGKKTACFSAIQNVTKQPGYAEKASISLQSGEAVNKLEASREAPEAIGKDKDPIYSVHPAHICIYKLATSVRIVVTDKFCSENTPRPKSG